MIKTLESNWQTLRWILLAMAIVFAMAKVAVKPNVGADHIKGMAAAQSFVDGEGVSDRDVAWNDVSKTVFNPYIQMPLGYPFLLATVSSFTGSIQSANLTLTLFSVLLFFLSWFFIYESLGKEFGIKEKLFIWGSWVFIYNPLAALRPAGLMALSLFSTSFALSLVMISGRPRLILALVAGVLLGGSAVVRYAYWPLVFVLPFCLFLYAKRYDKKIFKPAILTTIVSFSLLAIPIIRNYVVENHSSILHVYERGLCLPLLLKIHPFPLDVFNLKQSYFLITHYLLRGGSLQFIVYGVSLVMLFVLAYEGKIFFKEKKNKSTTFFMWVGFLVISLTLLMLMSLAVYICGAPLPIVSEQRYFVLFIPFSVFLLARFIINNRNRNLKLGVIFLLLPSLFQIYHRPQSFYAHANRDPRLEFTKKMNNVDNFSKMLQTVKAESKDPIAYLEMGQFTYDRYHRRNIARLEGIPVFEKVSKRIKLKTSQPVTVVLGVRGVNKRNLGRIRRARPRKVGQWGETDFYQFTYLPPQEKK